MRRFAREAELEGAFCIGQDPFTLRLRDGSTMEVDAGGIA